MGGASPRSSLSLAFLTPKSDDKIEMNNFEHTSTIYQPSGECYGEFDEMNGK